MLKIFLTLCVLITLAPLLYSANKVLPFSKEQFFFPDHPIIDFLKSDRELSRFYGIDTAYFATNFASYFGVYSPEGYGVLRLEKYAQLVAATRDGEVPQNYERADAVFPSLENGYRKKALDLLGVKYFLDKNDLEEGQWTSQPERFPNDHVELTWQEGKFKVYTRLDALPRYFQTTSFNIENDKGVIKKIYDDNFDLKTLLLTDSPNIPISSESYFTIPQLVDYSTGRVEFKTDAPYSTLLFISDAYASGWSAYVDRGRVPILKTDYAFRSVAVGEGSHEVVFKYQPMSFTLGVIVSALTLLILTIFVKLQYFQKKF